MSSKPINYRDLALLRQAGLAALQRELGPVGTACFLRLFSSGQGNYTREREQQLAGITLDEIVRNVREMEEKAAEVPTL
jgi:hypothetical protein